MQGNDNNFIKYLKNFNEETGEFENQEHYPADHESEMKMFYGEELSQTINNALLCDFDQMDENEKEIYKSFMKIISKAKPAKTYVSEHNKESIYNNKTEKLMVYPNNNAGLSIITTKDESTKEDYIYTVFPFISKGHEYNCKIKSLLCDCDEVDTVEGQIEAFIDEEENLLLTFYDIHFLDNKSLYNPNDTFKFTIMGLATNIEIISNDDLISLDPAYDKLSQDYRVNTIVRKVKLLDNEINGEKVWKLSIVIGFTPDGEDIPLEIYATSRSFEDSIIPQEGDNISANISIHGYLTGIEK